MLVTTATVRRDGRMVNLDAAELVVGDVVSLQAGDRVPADGRLLTSTGLEVQESSLTGEAQPVGKSATAHVDADAALGDRSTVAFMNTTVTRGHAELVVTATGMNTEIGRIAGMLHEAEPEPTPLQRQIAGLSRTLAMIAGAVIVVVFVLGLVRGQDFAALFVSAVSLAVAAIPEGLPAVVAFTLAMGTTRLARRGAIVKRLASVETLGSTSQICTDKTGTLTLNQMTARRCGSPTAGSRCPARATPPRAASGPPTGPPLPATVEQTLLAMALCTDAELRDDEVIGDPTEGALLVLAEKGGIDVGCTAPGQAAGARGAVRLGLQVHGDLPPLDDDRDDREVVRCFVKGAPDVLAARADRYLGGTDILRVRRRRSPPLRPGQRRACRRAACGCIAVGAEDFPPPSFDSVDDPKDLLDRIVLVALVGIVDPPRPEARKAIAQCRDAGIRVRMITGDHAVTAGAIAADLGIPGEAVTGATWTGCPTTPTSPVGSTTSAWSPASPPSTRSGSCGRCRAEGTSSR